MVPGRSCTIPVADVGKMLQKFKPKSATLQFWLCKRGDEQQKKPQLLLTSSCWCSMKISRLAKPVLVPNLWNIKDFSPSGRFWPQFHAGVIRIWLNLVRCDSCGRLKLGFEFVGVFPVTRNVFSFRCHFGGKKIHICFYFPLKNSQTVLWAIKY